MQQTQTQKPITLTPADPLGARFCQWFNHPWRHIYAPVPAPGDKPQWQTSKYFLDSRTLWRRYQDPNTLVGLRFGDETSYALLDIDSHSPYHPADNFSAFKDVLNALEEIGLCRPCVVQSSWSGGLHVYYFFSEPLPTFVLACAIKFALEDAGLPLRTGQLESFPNTKAWDSFYNAHRLPLQVGSYLLDDDLEPLTDDLALFLDAADTAARHQDLTALQAYCAQAKERYEPRRISGRPKGDAAEWKRDLEERISEGWTGHGQTNLLLKDMVCYGVVWLGLSGSALEDYVVATATAAPGYQEYCRHQHEIRDRARHWGRSTEELNRYYSRYCSYPERLGDYKKMFDDASNNVVPFKSRINEERSAQAQDRIKQVVSLLEAATALPKAVVGRVKAIIAKGKEIFSSSISRQTLWKHLTLWHPKHYRHEPVLQQEPAPSANSSEIPTPPRCSTEISPQPESLEPAPSANSSENSHTPPLMKVRGGVLENGKPPQGAAIFPIPPELISRDYGCSSSGARVSDDKFSKSFALVPPATPATSEVPLVASEVPPTDDATPAATANASPVDAQVPVDLKTLSRLTRFRVQAINHAQKAVRQQALHEKRFFSKEERERHEATAKMQFFWRSGEPVLMREATEWARANPDALPEALPLGGWVCSAGAADEPPADEPPLTALSTLYDTCLQRPDVEELPADEPPLKVRDRVWWDNCPGHCSWMNPFTITTIDGDMAWLDFYSEPVPLSCLRRALDSQ